MKKKQYGAAILVYVLALGLVFTACPTNSGGDGTNDNTSGKITISGDPKVGETLTATYNADDFGSPIWWESNDSQNPADGNSVGNGSSYTVDSSDVGKYIRAGGFDSSYNEVYSNVLGPVTE
jgi:hypothetical protein